MTFLRFKCDFQLLIFGYSIKIHTFALHYMKKEEINANFLGLIEVFKPKILYHYE